MRQIRKRDLKKGTRLLYVILSDNSVSPKGPVTIIREDLENGVWWFQLERECRTYWENESSILYENEGHVYILYDSLTAKEKFLIEITGKVDNLR